MKKFEYKIGDKFYLKENIKVEITSIENRCGNLYYFLQAKGGAIMIMSEESLTLAEKDDILIPMWRLGILEFNNLNMQ